MMQWKKHIGVAAITAVLGLAFGVALGTQFRSSPAVNSTQPAPVTAPERAVATAPSVTSVPSSQSLPRPKIAEATPRPPVIDPLATSRPALWRTVPAANAPVVCVDPGHPSETSDGANANGLSENKMNWEVAVSLKQKLEAAGIRCVLTKSSMNQHRTNRERAEIANRADAAVFVRLHCDVGNGEGYTWYYPDRSGQKQGVTGPSRQVQQESRRAASIINTAMQPVLQDDLQSNPIKTDAATFVGGKQGGVLTGSIFAKVPTALIEMCYISQKKDAQFIASQNGQDKMAEALSQGIQAYLHQI